MRYKNYSSKEKKNLKQFTPYIIENAFGSHHTQAGSSQGSTDFRLPQSIAKMELVMSFFYRKYKKSVFGTVGQMICAGSPKCK